MTPYRKRMNPYVRRMAEDMHWQRYRSRSATSRTRPSTPTPTTSTGFADTSGEPPTSWDWKKSANTRCFSSKRRKPAGVASTKLCVWLPKGQQTFPLRSDS